LYLSNIARLVLGEPSTLDDTAGWVNLSSF
jgi:hypothetical protein